MNWNISFSTSTWRARRYRRHGPALAAVLLLSGACAMAEAPDDAPAGVPEGAIPAGPDLYMLPMGTDEAGCPVFQPWSPTLMVVQALHWRAADGSFTLDRDAADCPPLPDPAPG